MMTKVFKFVITATILASLVSFGSIYYTTSLAGDELESMEMTESDYVEIAKQTGVDVADIRAGFEAAKEASDDPLRYPGFYRYWFDSFLIWFAVFSAIALGLLLWQKGRRSGGKE